MTTQYLKTLQATGNKEYFDAAELDAEKYYHQYIKQHIPGIKDRAITEIACGHGRITNQILKDFAPKTVTLVDINQENLWYCKNRFKNFSNLKLIKTKGTDLEGIESNSQDFVYSFDSFVHFNKDLVELYIIEIKRVLKEGGTCFLHYSNSGKSDLSSKELGHGLRGTMTKEAMIELLMDTTILHNESISWGIENLDAIIVFKKIK